MADRHRLRALEVGVSRHRRLRVRLGAVEHGRREVRDPGPRLGGGVGDVEAKRSRHLVVARAPRVDLPADLAEQALDRGVDVLVLRLDPAAGRNLGQPRLDLRELGVVEQPGPVQPPRVHRRRLAVVREQLAVVGSQEGRDGGIERAPDPAAPEAHASDFALSRAAASSTSSDAILMKPSAAECGNVSPVPYEASCSA